MTPPAKPTLKSGSRKGRVTKSMHAVCQRTFVVIHVSSTNAMRKTCTTRHASAPLTKSFGEQLRTPRKELRMPTAS